VQIGLDRRRRRAHLGAADDAGDHVEAALGLPGDEVSQLRLELGRRDDDHGHHVTDKVGIVVMIRLGVGNPGVQWLEERTGGPALELVAGRLVGAFEDHPEVDAFGDPELVGAREVFHRCHLDTAQIHGAQAPLGRDLDQFPTSLLDCVGSPVVHKRPGFGIGTFGHARLGGENLVGEAVIGQVHHPGLDGVHFDSNRGPVGNRDEAVHHGQLGCAFNM